MNDDQAKAALGLLGGIVLIGMLAAGWYLQRPVADRTIVIFAGLLWATLQADITGALPFSIGPPQRADNEDDGE